MIGVTFAFFSFKQSVDMHSLLKNWKPIRYVRVGGVFQHLAKEDVKQVLQPLLSTGFIMADLQAIRAATVSLPWVADAEVRRVWPDAIDIRVYEHKPLMRWGKNSLLTEQGDIFTLNNTAGYNFLPLLMCPRGQQRRFLEIMKGLQITLADHSLHLKKFIVTERLAWQVVLENGIKMKLGRIKQEQLNNLQRFLKTVPLLRIKRINAIATVDMRYPNGYAVTWKSSEIIDWKAVDGPGA